MRSTQSAEETELLTLLKELQSILLTALQSVEHTKPPTPEAWYLGYAAKSVSTASGGYIVLKEADQVDAAKMFIRPILDFVISATAVMKRRGFLFQKQYTECLDWTNSFPRTPANAAAAKEVLKDLKRSFQEEPGYPIRCERVSARDAAEVADLMPAYEAGYRIYCNFTHGSVLAAQGHLDNATDPADTKMVIWCVFTMLDHLKKHTAADIPDLSSFKKKSDELRMAM
jgi:hypothetical protein